MTVDLNQEIAALNRRLKRAQIRLQSSAPTILPFRVDVKSIDGAVVRVDLARAATLARAKTLAFELERAA